mgnify:CR=1 FL=1
MISLNITNKLIIDSKVIETVSNINNNAIYISAPITTGNDFINWYSKNIDLFTSGEIYKHRHYNEIVKPNLSLILKYYNELKSKYNTSIIEPASLEMPNWSQDEYLYYWGEIIKKSIVKIIFLDGWSYSKGCSYEYYVGLKKGIEIVDQNQNSIDKKWAINQIKIAISEYENIGIDTDLQKQILIEIQNECK